MADNIDNSAGSADDMSEYLQTFLDETEEQLDDLVETMLVLENDPDNHEHLNEAFRLIHSIKGSAGMMGFDNITVLTHQLENRFEMIRSGTERLNDVTMALVFRCVDFLRQCNNRLRDGEALAGSSELLDELRKLEDDASTTASISEQPDQPHIAPKQEGATATTAPAVPDSTELHHQEDTTRIVVRFRAGLPLADLKAQLIVTRMAKRVKVVATHPPLDQLHQLLPIETFEILVEGDENIELLREASDVEGVESVDFGETSEQHEPATANPAASQESAQESTPTDPSKQGIQTEVPAPEAPEPAPPSIPHAGIAPPPDPLIVPKPSPPRVANKVGDTMRVEIDRLDHLMNLAGELVVNRARFVEIADQISPDLGKATAINRLRDFSGVLKGAIESLQSSTNGDRASTIQALRDGLTLMQEQTTILENGRTQFTQMSEAIDQLSRVSKKLQQGVLGTRMVPVSPLFNRFKRVVRDLSMERGKEVHLVLEGEKTELDKRMVDELGDPLVHLVRNAIDHGLELPEVRVARGKPETGTIFLEASHSGNNVFIRVRDDGGGIDVEKVKAKAVENSLVSASEVEQLSDEQVLDYIWHPGFSTAGSVTDVSGRGVGMDVVKTRIGYLSGSIEVESSPDGTSFTLKLPLTLAIMNCLMVRLRNVIFSMPVDDVREIVSVRPANVVTIKNKQTVDFRGHFIPLVGIDDLFNWHQDMNESTEAEKPTLENGGTMDVVVLHSAGQSIGLRVDTLLGSQDIVVKSLSDNFVNIPGLSGASILGDGSVSLMLDVGRILKMTYGPSLTRTQRLE